MIAICEFCNNEYKTFKNWYNRAKHHTCSRKCASDLKKKLSTKECKTCGKSFYSKSHQSEKLYCSKKCFGKSRQGENHHHWKPDVHDKTLRNALKDWGRKIKIKDGFTCQRCGCVERKLLEAHHIKSKHEHPELRFDLTNGITLCIHCHAEEHKNDPKAFALISYKIKLTNVQLQH
jgi:hypothetical protein